MVYHVQEINSKVTVIQSALAGGISGAITRALAQPLDVLKIRFQLQLEPIQSGSKYSSVIQAVFSIIREEGIATLWSGHLPAQLLSISYGIVQFSLYEKLTQICQTTDPYFFNSHRHYLNFSNGAIAATAATIISFPFDTVRTRLIAEQKTNRAYYGFIDAFSTMVKYEGPTALFKGLVPTVAQIAPHAGIQFAVYKLCTENIFVQFDFFQRPTTLRGTVESSLIANVLAGGIAGFVSKTMIYPFDVVKKRLQIQGFQEHRKAFGRQMYCRGTIHCIWLTVTKEGLLALYKGLGPSILKAIIVSALHFTIYDEIKNIILRNQ